MLSDEEKEILINIKEYMQNDIDKGYHKFVYNDLGSDFKCIDCINAIDNVLNLIEKKSKEMEEYKKQLDLDNECEIALNSKVMDLEKEIEELKNADLTTVYLNGVYDGEKKVKDKIKAKIEDLKENSNGDDFNLTNVIMLFKSLLEKE